MSKEFEEFWEGIKVEPEIEKIRLKGICSSIWLASREQMRKECVEVVDKGRYSQMKDLLIRKLKELK